MEMGSDNLKFIADGEKIDFYVADGEKVINY
jgi:hypothetical protein